MILLNVTDEDLVKLEPILGSRSKSVEKYNENGVILVKTEKTENYVQLSGKSVETSGPNKETVKVDVKTTDISESVLSKYVGMATFESVMTMIGSISVSGVCFICRTQG